MPNASIGILQSCIDWLIPYTKGTRCKSDWLLTAAISFMFGFAVPNASIPHSQSVRLSLNVAVSRQMTHLTSIFPHGTRSLSYWTGFKRSMRLDSPLFPTKSVHLNDNSVSLAILTNNGWFSTWLTRIPLFNQSITIGIYDMNCQWQDWSIGTRHNTLDPIWTDSPGQTDSPPNDEQYELHYSLSANATIGTWPLMLWPSW